MQPIRLLVRRASSSRLAALFSRLLIWCLFLAPLALALLFSYQKAHEQLTALAYVRREAVVSLVSATVHERLERMLDLAKSLASRVRFRELIRDGRWDEAAQILQDIPAEFPFVERVFVTDLKGTLMADTPSLAGVKGQNFAFRDWYQGVSRDWNPFISGVYQRTAEPRRNVVAAAVPIRDPDGSKTGILVVQVRLEQILEWVKQIDAGPGGVVYVTDQKGRIVAHPGFPLQGQIADFSGVPAVQKALQGQRGLIVSEDGTDRGALSAYAPVPSYGWGVAASQPAREAFAQRDATLRNLAIVYGIFLLMACFAAFMTVGFVNELIRAKALELEGTRLKEAYEALREAQERLVESEKLGTIGRMAAGVAHEIRNPLGIILQGTDYLKQQDAVTRQAQSVEVMGIVNDAVRRADRIVQKLLALSKPVPLKISPVSMRAVMEEALSQVDLERPLRPVRISREFTAQPDIAAVDREQMCQVWINLIENALHAMPDAGSLTLRTRRQRASAAEPGVLWGRPGIWGPNDDLILCEVSDTGKGISQDVVKRIFDPFFTTKRSGEGIGLGLAIVRSIVHSHRGEISVSSPPGQGTTFRITLKALRAHS